MTVFAVPSMPLTERASDAFDALAEVDSTNAELRRRCLAGDPFVRRLEALANGRGSDAKTVKQGEGTAPIGVLAAQTQSGGHGRLGRSWSDAAGESFVASFLAVLPRGLVFGDDAGWLTMAAGVAAVDGVTSVTAVTGALPDHDGGAAVRLKWPNDVFVTDADGSHGRKLGGILTEAAELTGGTDNVALIIGIGLNLAIPADRLPTDLATSLQLRFGPLPPFDELRDRIGAGIVATLRRELGALAADPAAASRALHERVRALCWTIGRPVEVRRVDGSVLRGVARDIAADASLIVGDETSGPDGTGVEHVVRTGDVGVLAPETDAAPGANENTNANNTDNDNTDNTERNA
ncbi:biotin--[acetyl-CoA-carboxylase] ligase [Bifidobacterium avesanii]|uniref:Biotin--acetyl-CoA-carboxylase ligase n=1 Tax=Bifidobacterium avesanii TaxID=1798157 RepID=A0A7K3TG76_9BIFI|nr:biotin--[acetyl-CoA-carboxylase] ligase [Bifidobacterium avesanii]KAB8294593.1 biotin--[acetyl-CoA-carboxylase] ligase [Bifidobacterium avesanii]NEG78101.1 biotin--acetyl-CoA-carboxylase ligase [Bifidobacterium avesanii]